MALQKIKDTLEMIKFSHSIFAMPFALASMLVAAQGAPSWISIVRIVLALVFARTAAMAFNRLIDADIDAENPRTKDRHIPKGLVSKHYTWTLIIFSALGFFYVSYLLGSLCALLAPFVLLILFLYSYTKRFTSYTQIFLGLALGLSPIGAWIAITNHFALVPFILGLGVLFWVAGFDILYAAQDYNFDKEKGLQSMVVKFGIPKSFQIARGLHLLAFVFFFIFGVFAHLHWAYYLGLTLMALLFFRQHTLVSPENLSRIDAAFFQTNGLISLIFLVSVYFGL